MVISGKFHPKQHDDKLDFKQKKKYSVRHPKMVVFAILRLNVKPLSGIEKLFFLEI